MGLFSLSNRDQKNWPLLCSHMCVEITLPLQAQWLIISYVAPAKEAESRVIEISEITLF